MNAALSLLRRWLPARQKTAAEQLLQSLFVMAWMVEARDPYTGGHLWRVSQYSRLLAQDAGLPGADVARITLGGFLHDLGKISVPDAILNKPDRLTEDEYEVIKTHPEVGARLLAEHPLAPLANAAVLHHHERPDGTGYPARLLGERVPIDARIVGICDAFDAMTSTRPYRRGMAVAQALAIIEDNLDHQFDRALGTRFLALGRDGALDHIVGHTDHGIPLQDCPVCGPTIVVRRSQRDGEHVYCRHCGSEATVAHRDGHVCAIHTGRKGTAQELEAEADLDVIGELVRASAASLENIRA
ncbi:HD domain-containing phosphohydrolase [Sulfurivermis fontis]|uniref:HD domain-containing phosphohydrolase n=1 Tax=Sulfurivermis fontis TaxID=1972068 RepID=UPI000FDB1492|nr:HD domain-containing phosphohydrolase [Sulfurivermis fontis]